MSLLDYDRDEVIEFLTARLNREKVKSVYLFGSFARNEHGAWSDIDIIIVGDFSLPFIERPREFFDLFDLGIALNILAYTEQELRVLLQSLAAATDDRDRKLLCRKVFRRVHTILVTGTQDS